MLGYDALLDARAFCGCSIDLQEEYAEQICWSTDTYYVAMNETIENYTSSELREKRVSYYQVGLQVAINNNKSYLHYF